MKVLEENSLFDKFNARGLHRLRRRVRQTTYVIVRNEI